MAFLGSSRVQKDWYLIAIGAAVGTLTGAGAVGFEHAIQYVSGRSATLIGSLPLWLLPVVPIVGALVCGALVTLFASDARGHGVPQVIQALMKHRAVIPLRVGVVKALASIATVGSGGSAGVEGPIVQIGATAGSVVGRWLRIGQQDLPTLVGCGAASGIAAIFNAPIAGVIFVLEVLLRDFSARTFAPIVVAAVFATATSRAMMGEADAIFATSTELTGYEFTLSALPSYVVLGVLAGLIGVGFSRALHFAEDRFAGSRTPALLRPALGALLLGLLGIGFVGLTSGGSGSGELPPFFGNGYDTIRMLIEPRSYRLEDASPALWFVLALLAAKLMATCFTLGSGGSGGVFAPALFMGAALGSAFGSVLDRAGLLPEGHTPAPFALVGMAAVMTAAMHCPLTAILILFELTGDVYVLVPVMLAAIVATMTAQLLERDSIYTYRLRRAGLALGSAHDLAILRRIPVSSVRITELPQESIMPSDPLAKLVSLHAYHDITDFVVTDENGAYVGMVTGADIRTALIDREAIPLLLVAELLRTDLPTIHPDETLDAVMGKFTRADVSSLPMVSRNDPKRVTGLVTRGAVMQRYQRTLDES